MKSRKRTRSPEEHVRSTGGAGTLRTEVGVTVSPHVGDPEESVFDRPERENTVNTATQSAPITLTEFLRMRLPYLEENPLHTKSTATRAPQFYDRHLADALRLKKVAFIDKRFFEVLSKICDHYIKQLLENGEAKAILSSFPDFVPPSREHIKNENSLVSYCEDINKYISLIASALLFRTNCNAAFGFSAQTDLTASDDAAADAYFFARRGVDFLLPAEHGPNFDLVHKYDLQIPINWEYKNLGFGSQIFFALQTQGGDFHWTACQERSARHGATSKCPNHIHRTEGRLTITGRPTGPDASATVDIIKDLRTKTFWTEEERPTKRVGERKSAAEKKGNLSTTAWTSAVVQSLFHSDQYRQRGMFRHTTPRNATVLISPPISQATRQDLLTLRFA
ncbi:hypothetical protein CPB84DRAFT_1843857 [Gymnopilus junonius]|uniref:Uncharacterized protein n=1 Tax=Gymnopilus junonius TaxID=109634 RepID=A0A9P5NWE3_GYMJU|nr:hypothetical protein CPB84DRAFT_1843857 [Gymnopilus junonius]